MDRDFEQFLTLPNRPFFSCTGGSKFSLKIEHAHGCIMVSLAWWRIGWGTPKGRYALYQSQMKQLNAYYRARRRARRRRGY